MFVTHNVRGIEESRIELFPFDYKDDWHHQPAGHMAIKDGSHHKKVPAVLPLLPPVNTLAHCILF